MGALDGLGIAQGLGALGSGLSGGYYGAMGTVFNRNLQTMAAQSEANLKNAQSQYFSGRNNTAQGVADTRANGAVASAGLRSQAQIKVAAMAAEGRVPANFAGQDPYTTRALIHKFDQLSSDGSSGGLEQSLYGTTGEGLPGMDGQGMAGQGINTPGMGGAFAPYAGPTSPMGAPQPGMPPAAPGMAPAAPGGFGSGGGGSFASMGGPPPPVPGAPPQAPMPGPDVQPPLMSPQGPGAPPQGPGGPPQGPGGPPQGPGVPPLRNPFNVPPLTAARIGNLTATTDLTAIKAGMYPQLTLSRVQENMATANLRGSQGKFYDARTNEVVPMAQAKILLDNAQAGKANMDTQTLPEFRQGLIQNGATTAGANASRAATYGQVAPIDAEANATRANSGADYQQGMLSVAQQNANTRASGTGAGGQINTQVNQQQAIIDKNNAQKIQILRGLMVKGTDGAMTQRQPTTNEQNMINAADTNIHTAQHQQNVLRGGSQPGQLPGGAYNGPVPRSQADFQAMPAAQKAAYIMSLRHQNGH